ncbi:MAG TPA: sigma-70 family RNA polymerase sigma factor, partial [Planctomycetota bacterium]|nr:sigma-70 family RNA polymerase sigma factor [Planctomycetota bacterium]
METETVEAAFARFCESCDPRAMAEVFDRTAVELRPLARRLTRGSTEADDLVQETFLAAIENRASFDPARQLMPWLVGILVRQASAARRRARREIDPARVDAKSQPTPDLDVESEEFKSVVLSALARLSRNDRDVLMPLLFDGKRAVQIARELGSRPDTVRMRIHRGLERLRRLLPASLALPGLAGEARAWREVRSTVIASAARLKGVPVPLAPVAPTSTAWAGALAALALLVSLAVIFQLTRSDEKSADPLATSMSEPLESPTRDALASETRGEDLPLAREQVALAEPPATLPAAAPDRIRLTGRVRGLSPRELATARVEIAGLGPDPIARRIPALLGSDASFEADVSALVQLGARRLLVRVDQADHLPAEARVELGESAVLSAGTLTLHEARTAEGRVVAHDGAALGSVTVGLFSLLRGAQDVLPVDVAVTDADGRFHLRSPAGGAHVVIAFRDDARPASRLAELGTAALDLGTLRLEPGLTIAGRVEAPDEDSLRGVRVRCEATKTQGERKLRLGDRRFVRTGDGYELATVIAACDGDGRFAFNGLGERACDVSVLELGETFAVAADPPGIPAPPIQAGVRAPCFDLKLPVPWSRVDFVCAPLDDHSALRFGDEFAVDVEPELDARAAGPKVASVRLRPRPGVPALLQARPGTRYRVTVIGGTHDEAGSFVIEVPARGRASRVTLEADKAALRAALVLHFDNAAVPRGERVGAGFFTAGSPPRLLFERSAVVDNFGGASFDDLPAG